MAKEKQVIIVLDDADTINGNCIFKTPERVIKLMKSDKNGHRHRHQ